MLGRALANLKKTVYYFQRNGAGDTMRAIMERLQRRGKDYRFQPVEEAELARQREECREMDSPKFSILVPLYHTPHRYLKEMIESVLAQSYPTWELVLADASGQEELKAVVEKYEDPRILYFPLEGNEGISGNSNRGLESVTGDYVGLLDHDDLLTPDALYEVWRCVCDGEKCGVPVELVYSDEDKCDGATKVFYEPSLKESFNLDLLLSQNYICHFTVMKTELIRALGFRPDYDGAQDYDLLLRAVERLLNSGGDERRKNRKWEMRNENRIRHIPRVLYHWRCHEDSTSANPRSKDYAYEAGRRALQDFVDRQGWQAVVTHMSHLGSYRINYKQEFFEVRPDVGAVGGPVLSGGRVVGGRLKADGTPVHAGLKQSYLAYLPVQDAEALDLRNIRVREELQGVFEEVLGVRYTMTGNGDSFDISVLTNGISLTEAGVLVSNEIRRRGYRLLFKPDSNE